jgi:hypothetical protein
MVRGREGRVANGGTGECARDRWRAQVVILAAENEARVEVLELPPGVTVGSDFHHLETEWRIIARRRGSGVLIAEPQGRVAEG